MSEMHIVTSAKHNQAEELLNVPLEKYKYLYTNSKGNKIYGYRTKNEFFGKEFTTVVSEASYKKQKKGYEASKAKICEKLEDLKRWLGSNRGKGRDKSSVEREFNEIIYKDFRSIFGHKVGEMPEGKKKPGLEIWIENEVEKLCYAGFGKTIVFTDMHT